MFSSVDFKQNEWASSSSALSPIAASRWRFTRTKGYYSDDQVNESIQISNQFQPQVFRNNIPLLGVSSPFYRFSDFL